MSKLLWEAMVLTGGAFAALVALPAAWRRRQPSAVTLTASFGGVVAAGAT
jgi:hypothetical protein